MLLPPLRFKALASVFLADYCVESANLLFHTINPKEQKASAQTNPRPNQPNPSRQIRLLLRSIKTGDSGEKSREAEPEQLFCHDQV